MSSTEEQAFTDESQDAASDSSSRSNGAADSNAARIAEEADSPDIPVALAAGMSVLYSWYTFYIREDETYGLFVGLWAPTLLTFADYLRERQ